MYFIRISTLNILLKHYLLSEIFLVAFQRVQGKFLGPPLPTIMLKVGVVFLSVVVVHGSTALRRPRAVPYLDLPYVIQYATDSYEHEAG
jgi:hypothetical protein